MRGVCSIGCHKSNIYRAHKDTMRYCPRCNSWSHVECLGVGVHAQDVPWATDLHHLLPAQVGPLHGATVKARQWDAVVRHPIERKARTDLPFDNQPFTIEELLQHLRNRANEACRYGNTIELNSVKNAAKAWINGTYLDPDSQKHAKRAFQDIFTHADNVIWYNCCVCSYWI